MIDLYRFYDKAGTLLYVGISLSAAHRASRHRELQPWWLEVSRMDVEHLPVTRKRALELELEAIVLEAPLYNVQGTQNTRKAQLIRRRKQSSNMTDKQLLWMATAPICPICNKRPNEQYRHVCHACYRRQLRHNRAARESVTIQDGTHGSTQEGDACIATTPRCTVPTV